MGIFDRIRKFFSRSESSRTNRASSRLVQRSYQVEHYQHFNVSTNRPGSSNIIKRSSPNFLHRSNTTPITTQASSRSHSQPDANLKRTNTCNAPTLPLLRDTVYLPEHAKASNTAATVSELPRVKSSNELKDSKISVANSYRRKCPRPNDSEVASAEYNTTSFDESRRKIASDLNSMQSTPKPKPTLSRNTFSSAGNIDVNHQLDFWQTTKRISTESNNTENKSSVEKDQSNTSKGPTPITSQAKIVHSMSYRTPAISHQEVILSKNHMIQTLSNTNTSAIDCSYTPHEIERKLSVHNQGVGDSGKTRQHSTAFNTTETCYSTVDHSLTSTIDRSLTPHKIERKLLDHNQGVGGSGNTQRLQTTTFSKTETPSISQTSAFSSSTTLHKTERPKLSDHNFRGIRETFGNSQQRVTLNKINTTQIDRVSNAFPPMTSYKRDSTTVADHRSVRMDELEPKGISCGTSTIPQLTRTYVDVDKVLKAPRKSILKPKRVSSVFQPGKEFSAGSTPLSSPLHALHTNVVSVPVQFPPNTTRKSQLKSNKDTKPLYSLRNFTRELQTPPKDKCFKPENVIYHNQWTKCSAQIHVDNDELIHSLLTVTDVSIKCAHADFRDTKIEKGHLHFTMKCSATRNISILIKTDKFELTKDFEVIFNPCSSYCSKMKIEEVCLEDKFVFRVFIFDVFGEPVPFNSTANCQVNASSQNFNVREVQLNTEEGQICYDITVRGERPWSQDLVVLLNGEQINHPRAFEVTEKECKAIIHIDDKDYEWILEIFDQNDCGITIPLTTGDDDGKFVAYNENNCKLQSQNVVNQKLICKNVRKYDVLGEDCAHINNIKRVLDLKDRIEVQETDDCAIIVLRNVQTHLHPVCKGVVQHLLRGLYYRKKAQEAARVRMEWKDRLIGIDEVLWLDRKSPSFVFCKYFKDFFGDLMNKYNREACNELFKFFNFQRDESEVDLHGLLVADEEKLKSLRLNLLIGSLSEKQIKKILEICKIFSKHGRERQTLRKNFRKGKVPEKLIKIFLEGGRRDNMNDKSLNELEHACSDEDCRLCFGYYIGHDDDDYDDFDGNDYDDFDDYDYDDFDDDDYDDFDDNDYDDFDDDDYDYDDDDDDYDEEHYDDGDYDDDHDDDYDDGENWQSTRNLKRTRFLPNESESSRGNDQRDDVDDIIRRCREESDEAIRKLKEKLDKFNLKNAIKNNTPWLEIIVGAGRHSKKNEQNIRPKVEKLLKERDLKFSVVNKGSLVVTFKPYSGPEPCFGEYFCEKCDRCWKSSKSFVKKYQKCSSCKANCWPVKQREKEKFTNYRRDGYVKRQSKPHQASLCQRCQEMGRPCNEYDNYDSDY